MVSDTVAIVAPSESIAIIEERRKQVKRKIKGIKCLAGFSGCYVEWRLNVVE